jgi:hypothetical protein
VAQRFTAAITGLFQCRLYSLLKNSSFVSGHRFSDAVSSLNSDAPLGAGHGKRSFSANCLAAEGNCGAHKEFLSKLLKKGGE